MKKRTLLMIAFVLTAVLSLVSCSDDSTGPVNGKPVIDGIASDPVSVEIGSAASITCSATDPDGDEMTYAWTAISGTIDGSGASITWTAPIVPGTYTVSCRVGDGEHSTDGDVAIPVYENVVAGAMVTIAGGTFDMGDSYDEGNIEERPVHTVTLDSYRIGKYELTQGEWAEYMDPPTYGTGSGALYPVYNVSWFDVVMYCNLRSLDEGLTPCYVIAGSTLPSDWPGVPNYTSDSGFATWNAVECNWSADGYRMPTEAEWEYAARGAAAYGDDFRYSGSQTAVDVAWINDNAPNACQAVGGLAPNQSGLYDMSGNLYELCWDWYAEDYYTECDNGGTVSNPVGPAASDMRIVRGGSWGDIAANCRVAGRFRDYPVSRFDHTGVRLVRKP